ncbi:MAG TPA: hypothetical protein VFA09_17840 [Ktedonobacteraceae bacterium]|jgi:hypothetical protein|nr:hypothetical protein [Ktedonobacteraceae bacterium]
MALEDFTDPEVAIVAAVAAAVFSPTVRGWIRRGAVYATAGVLVAGDAITSVARGIGQNVQQAGATASNAAQNAMNQAKASASSAETSAASTGQSKTTGKTTAHHTKSSTEDQGGTAS